MSPATRFVSVLQLLCLTLLAACLTPAAAAPPNVLLIFVDDMGYGDLSCFGSEKIRTPHIDRLAKEGRKFTSFMVASPVCTPSRAALLTGCYPKRVGLHQHVLFPTSTKGLHPAEHTLADHLKAQGYATACFGKWHLGHHPEVLPTANGFDTYFGIPYSNDMNHPDNKGKPPGGWEGMDRLWTDPSSTLTQWQTPLFQDTEIVELPVDQRTITRRYTQKAIDFVTTHRDQPFFIYLPHSMPHIPLYVPDDVRDPNPLNAYTNTIEHIDAEIGRLLTTLDDLGLAQNTLVIFTSDNGPITAGGQDPEFFQSAGPLRGLKFSLYEGGIRVPCLVRWPGRVPAGTSSDRVSDFTDLLPTFAELIRQPAPAGLDGVSILPTLLGRPQDQAPRRLHYWEAAPQQALREGDWKLYRPAPDKPAELYHLGNDPGETTDLAAREPKRVAQMTALLAAERTEHPDFPLVKKSGRKGKP
jgi:arylsulfatase A